MMLKKPRVFSTEIRGLKRKTSEQWSRNTRIIYGKGVEGCSTSPWRQTEDQEVDREIWDWCWLLGRLFQQSRSVRYLNGVTMWPLSLNTSSSELVSMQTGMD